MPKISPNNPVRRRLFPIESVEHEAQVDNCVNILQELTDKDIERNTKKYNFDFVNEKPLEGDYEWFKKDGDEWIGIKPEKKLEKCEDKYKFKSIQFNNENTPVQVRDETVPQIRKRKINIEMNANGLSAKRRIELEFDKCYKR